VGGGIVGLATAYQILISRPGTAVIVLEKEYAVGQHQTGNNSGVLHAGLYYKPGSAKARLAVEGLKEMVSFCQANNVAHEICGKIVVATNQAERGRLQDLYERGQKNGLRGLKFLDRAAMLDIEPHAGGIAAVHVPEEGIVDYPGVCGALVRQIEGLGGKVVTGAKVTTLQPSNSCWKIGTSKGDFHADFLINCAGLHCDRVLQQAQETRQLRIVPFRGEYFKLRADRQFLVHNLIYPVPDPQFPFLGVHFTRLIHGGIEAGPNAVLAFAREGYRKSDVNLRDLYDSVAFSGLWRFLGKHPRMSWDELKRSFSKDLFCAALRKLVPEIQASDLEPGGAGVRAQAMSPDGALVQDFAFVARRNALHVLNAPSPAATACLAIGREIIHQIAEVF
jgi:L-2-hydroxyglutarate oxidase